MPEQLLELGFAKEIVIFIISMLPVFELRGAIPVGINVFDMPWQNVLVISFLGNLLVVPIIMLLFESVVNLLMKIEFLRKYVIWVLERTRKKGKMIEKYERIGLSLFVAAPLPITGAWTGAFAAVLLGISRLRAFISIAAGIFMAGIIVTILSLLGWFGALLAGLVLAVITIISYLQGNGRVNK